MSVLIESPEELLAVLKKLNVRIENVDELRHLLTTINASYNPEAMRQKLGRQLGLTVPSVMATAAGITSFFLLGGQIPHPIGGLALIWGACTLVSVAGILAGAILTNGRHRSPTLPDSARTRTNALAEEWATAIRGDLP